MSEEVSSQPVKEATPASPPKPKPVKRQADPTKPKITRGVKKRIELSLRKVKGIVGHIRNVQDNCLALGEKLIERGEIDLGREIIARAFRHDNSKFYGIEWDNMAPGVEITDGGAKLKLKLAVNHHNQTNPHHPEYWGSIHQMPRVAVGEMVADWKARSEEFGSSLRDWIVNSATKRFEFSDKDPVYTLIMSYVDLICEKPFTEIKS